MQEELGAALAPVAVPVDRRRRGAHRRRRHRRAARALAAGRWPPARRAARSPSLRDGDGWAAVPDADGADVVVVRDGDGWALAEGVTQREPVQALDPTRRLWSVAADGALDPLPGDGARAADVIAVALARRVGRRRPARDGDGGRVRQGARAVRPPDRRLPGRLARLRADAARGRGRALGRPLRRLGARPRARVRPAGRLDGQGLRLRRRLARARRRPAGPRRHRLHVGARPAPVAQARQGQRVPVGRRAQHRARVAALIGSRRMSVAAAAARCHAAPGDQGWSIGRDRRAGASARCSPPWPWRRRPAPP